ncbi:alanyl-tRNA synthetase [Pseudobutyrivibrio sp. OR37]|uniref:alanyl-tRNA editing protein n=1 Tax=Pseudobutyrivibrio sp. OR37 TaxID=1798186 RepID=UPI0008E2641F|nr:alanine--tRNA ligase-related protein [Pseudobutyrivibrio sp. OR37]SFH88041.1 alanyl-tRNA synthetase [Pseudobutyrivibrio sp. OR37]
MLYDRDAYAKEFIAKVISCEEAKKDDVTAYKVVLNHTLFFPEQGGQSSDIGTLDKTKVIDVQIENGLVYHYCTAGFLIGEEVHGIIDWEHRFNNMQQHTGEHLFTGIAHNSYGAENVGFHLSDNTVTLDLDIELSEEQVDFIERKANEIIASDVEVKAYYPNQELLGAINYRSKKEIDGPVRLVEIEGVDLCACCAPHVKSTGQIGMLKVISYGKYKGGTRVYILCGLRALEDYNRRMKILASSYQKLNCKEDELPDKIDGLIEDTKQLKYRINDIETGLLNDRIETISPNLTDVTIFVEDVDTKIMRDGVNTLVERHDGLCAIFSGNDDDGYNFVIGSKSRDCSAIATGLRELLGAKGGGSKQMAQGSVNATRTQIENTL